jgi:hypothetical protein
MRVYVHLRLAGEAGACVRVCVCLCVCFYLRLAGAAGGDDDRGPPHLQQDAVRTSLAAGLYLVSCCRFIIRLLWQLYHPSLVAGLYIQSLVAGLNAVACGRFI